MKVKKVPLHIQIIIGLVAGLAFGLLFIACKLPPTWVIYYVKPFGIIFINALKMVAVPLVLASLIVGIANLGDVSKLSAMGGKTILIYLVTTCVAITIGLVVAYIIQPGKIIKPETRDALMLLYESDIDEKQDAAQRVKNNGPLQPLVDLVPDNVTQAATDNGHMLQVVFFATLMGVALLQIDKKKGAAVIQFFDGLNDVVLKIIDYIMLAAPVGVFALIAALVVELAGNNPAKAAEVLMALLGYSLTVILGLVIMAFGIYPIIMRLFTKIHYKQLFNGIKKAQLLAFSTSSSAATLPVTIECAEQNLKIPEQYSAFVLPLGATINMDGTSLYQAVAAVFIAQALGLELSLMQQLTIVFTATLASIGAAGVPGAGIVMLVIVLESIGIPAAGIALIIAPDRLLDMCRTVVNVTGDVVVTAVVANTTDLAEGRTLSNQHIK